ncbi:MAG: hypothetical protein ABI261_08105 [Ginsengibacter sp.]
MSLIPTLLPREKDTLPEIDDTLKVFAFIEIEFHVICSFTEALNSWNSLQNNPCKSV